MTLDGMSVKSATRACGGPDQHKVFKKRRGPPNKAVRVRRTLDGSCEEASNVAAAILHGAQPGASGNGLVDELLGASRVGDYVAMADALGLDAAVYDAACHGDDTCDAASVVAWLYAEAASTKQLRAKWSVSSGVPFKPPDPYDYEAALQFAWRVLRGIDYQHQPVAIDTPPIAENEIIEEFIRTMSPEPAQQQGSPARKSKRQRVAPRALDDYVRS